MKFLLFFFLLTISFLCFSDSVDAYADYCWGVDCVNAGPHNVDELLAPISTMVTDDMPDFVMSSGRLDNSSGSLQVILWIGNIKDTGFSNCSLFGNGFNVHGSWNMQYGCDVDVVNSSAYADMESYYWSGSSWIQHDSTILFSFAHLNDSNLLYSNKRLYQNNLALTDSQMTVVDLVILLSIDDLLTSSNGNYSIALINPTPFPSFPVYLRVVPRSAFPFVFKFEFPKDDYDVRYRITVDDVVGTCNDFTGLSLSDEYGYTQYQDISIDIVEDETKNVLVELCVDEGIADVYPISYAYTIHGDTSVGVVGIDDFEPTPTHYSCDNIICNALIPQNDFFQSKILYYTGKIRNDMPFLSNFVASFSDYIYSDSCSSRVLGGRTYDLSGLCSVTALFNPIIKASMYAFLGLYFFRKLTKLFKTV